jgi:hypothetical protein
MEKNGVTVEAKDENGMPPLHVALLNDQLKFAEWLLNDCEHGEFARLSRTRRFGVELRVRFIRNHARTLTHTHAPPRAQAKLRSIQRRTKISTRRCICASNATNLRTPFGSSNVALTGTLKLK